MVTESKNKVKNPFESLKDEELTTQLTLAQEIGDWDKALQITEEIKKRKAPTKSSDYLEDFTKVHEDLKKRMRNKDPKKRPTEEELKKFFKKDVQNFASTVTKNMENLEKSKDEEISRLKGQLNTALLDIPGFTESLSLKRRRLVKITKRLDGYEKDKANYPKNFLVYAMALTESKRWGAGQRLKRGRVKMKWNKKSHNIKEELKNLDEHLKPAQ